MNSNYPFSIKEVKLIDYDIFPIYSLLLLLDGRIASSSYDALIKIYNIDTYEPELSIGVHTEEVVDLINIDIHHIASCSYDRSIIIFYICGLDYYCEHIYENAHDDWIKGICKLSMNRIASCSSDTTIKVWNINKPNNLIMVMKGHSESINRIIYIEDKNYLLSTSNDLSLRLWSMKTYQCISIIPFFGNGQSMLSIDDDNVIIGTVDYIKILNLTSLAIKQEINIEQYKGVYSMIYIGKGIYFCGTAKGKLLIYDINSNEIIQEVQYHKDTVATMLLVNTHIFLSGSFDELKVWSFEYK